MTPTQVLDAVPDRRLSLAWPDAVLRASVAGQHAIRANGKVQTVRLREGERREPRLG